MDEQEQQQEVNQDEQITESGSNSGQEITQEMADQEEATGVPAVESPEVDIYQILDEPDNLDPAEVSSSAGATAGTAKKGNSRVERRIQTLIAERKGLQSELEGVKSTVSQLQTELQQANNLNQEYMGLINELTGQQQMAMQQQAPQQDLNEHIRVQQPMQYTPQDLQQQYLQPIEPPKPQLSEEEVAKKVRAQMMEESRVGNAIRKILPEISRMDKTNTIMPEDKEKVNQFILGAKTDKNRQSVVEFLAESNLKNAMPEAISLAINKYGHDFYSMSVGRQCSVISQMGQKVTAMLNRPTQSEPLAKATGGGVAKKKRNANDILAQIQNGTYR